MPNIDTRFWSKVRFTDGCWIWTASLKNGYGQFNLRWENKTSVIVYAHRYAYERLIGPVPDGLDLDHLCRVPRCVRPEHLEPVTHRINCLRGESPAAQAARRPTCRNGHLFDAVWNNGGRPHRACRRCHTEYEKKRRQMARAVS